MARMHRRINAGTDIAMIGLWDASRNESPLKWKSDKDLEPEISEGHLFVLRTGSDGGGPVDVYVDEDVPADVLKTVKPIGREYLVAAPTGRLIVGGVEDYRAAKPRITGDDSIVTLPAGDYSLRCYRGPADDESEPASEKEIRKAVGAENVRYYDRTNNRVMFLGCATPIVLFAGLCFVMSWMFALPIALLAFLGYFHFTKWLLDRNPRYVQLGKQIDAMRLENQPPTFVFELRNTGSRVGLSGGSLQIDD